MRGLSARFFHAASNSCRAWPTWPGLTRCHPSDLPGPQPKKLLWGFWIRGLFVVSCPCIFVSGWDSFTTQKNLRLLLPEMKCGPPVRPYVCPRHRDLGCSCLWGTKGFCQEEAEWAKEVALRPARDFPGNHHYLISEFKLAQICRRPEI